MHLLVKTSENGEKHDKTSTKNVVTYEGYKIFCQIQVHQCTTDLNKNAVEKTPRYYFFRFERFAEENSL